MANRTEPDYNAIALALARKYTLAEVADKIGCTESSVSLLARGLSRKPHIHYRGKWLKLFRKEFPEIEVPQRNGKPYTG